MAKLTGPLFSLDAHGSIDNALTFSKRKSGAQVRFQKKQKMTVPAYAQIDNQSLYRVAYARWLAFTDAQREDYRDLATQSGQAISGWNYFLGKAIADPNTYLGLVGYWTFNKDASGTAIDVSKNGNTGTLKPSWPGNVPAYVESKNAKMLRALSFDGIDDYIDLGASIVATSFIFWVYLNIPPTEQYITRQPITANIFGLLGGDWAVHDTTWKSTTIPATAKVWQQIAFVYDGSKYLLYINDIYKGATINMAEINIEYLGYTSATINGIMDEVRIYNRAVSLTEIKKLYTLFQS